MILEVQHHAVLFKKKSLLISFHNNSLWKCRTPPNNYMLAPFHFDHGKYSVHSPLQSVALPLCSHAFAWKCEIKTWIFFWLNKTSLAWGEVLYVEVLPTTLILIKQIASVPKIVFSHIYEILVLHWIIQIYYSSACYCWRSWGWLYVEQVIHCLFLKIWLNLI